MNRQIISEYGSQCLPRYTSYPTAPNFQHVDGSELHRNWLHQIRADEPVSLYLHIPYCRAMCWYCGCHTKITRQDQPILTYLDALKAELLLVSEQIKPGTKLGHVHFGGGTPTIISPNQLLTLGKLIRESFEVTETAEIAVEIDPRTLSEKMTDAMAMAGVNRASLGVQSFDPHVQEAINRIQSFDQVADAVFCLRERGIAALNFDLIYGLPNQTTKSCISTVRQALSLHPARISVFGYAHVPGFKKHQRKIVAETLPDEHERYSQATAIAGELVAAGYVQIGLDHFALPDDPLARACSDGSLKRNFQGYTTDSCRTLIGVGSSSISRFEQGYIQNEVSISAYKRKIQSGGLAGIRQCELSEDDQIRAEIIERLMCDFSVDLNQICKKYGRHHQNLISDPTRLSKLELDGLIKLKDGMLVIQTDARFVVRAVAAAFDTYLNQDKRKFSTAA